MAKYRIVSKGNIVTIKSKLSFGEQINEREINIFEQQISAAVSDRGRKEKR